MKKYISVRLAGNISLIILFLLFIFHILVLFGVVPEDTIWSGQIDNDSVDMLPLEIISLIVTLIFMIIIAAKIGYLNFKKYPKTINSGVWVVCIYFILNTIGNLLSAIPLENYVFAPISLFLAFLTLKLAIEKELALGR